MKSRRGSYFAWKAPNGWKVSETINGVDLSSPSGKSAVIYAILMRSQGTITPMKFLGMMLSRLPGYSNFKLVSSKNLPDQPSGIPGSSWKIIEAEIDYTVSNKPVRGIWTCGINNYYGMYNAFIGGYHSVATEWPHSKFYLSEMERSISIINPRQVAGNDTLIPAQNHPLDNSGIIESGKLRGESMDRISKERREGTMGQKRLKDPETGQIYTMPLNKYDPAAGGYRNPKRPDELLVPTEPGE